MDAGAVGFATSVSKVHVGYSGRPVPSRLAELRRDAGDRRRRRQVGPRHHPVQCRPRSALGGVRGSSTRSSGRPLVWTALLAGSLGPNSHRPQLAKSGELIARGLPIYPQGACRPIQIEFDFRSPVVFDTCASFERLRAAPDDEARRAVYADKAFRARVKRQATGAGPTTSSSWARSSKATTRRAVFGTYVISEARRSGARSSASWPMSRRSAAAMPST